MLKDIGPMIDEVKSVVPVTAKLPAIVLVAVADVDTKADAVEVAVDVIAPLLVMPETVSVPVAVILVAIRLPLKYPLPLTSKEFEGELVPMPNRLLVLSQKKFALF